MLPAFIVGSPRSGTTLLGDMLDLHPEIARWYEPYFVLDRYFRAAPNDVLTAAEVNPAVRKFIRKQFAAYGRKRRRRIVVDKSPRNSLKIPFLYKIFPQARFIHIYRDGRDATLSIHREWTKRDGIIGEKKRPFDAFRVIWQFMNRQPLLRHKLMALNFEAGGVSGRLRNEPYLHRLRWNRQVGWGPRFADWQAQIDKMPTLVFNAHQWRACTTSVLTEFQKLPADQTFSIRYEDLIQNPEQVLGQVLDFLTTTLAPGYLVQLPTLKTSNFGKWEKAFSAQEKSQIGPILNPLLQELGYCQDDNWYLTR